jgi:hypothetical protein
MGVIEKFTAIKANDEIKSVRKFFTGSLSPWLKRSSVDPEKIGSLSDKYYDLKDMLLDESYHPSKDDKVLFDGLSQSFKMVVLNHIGARVESKAREVAEFVNNNKELMSSYLPNFCGNSRQNEIDVDVIDVNGSDIRIGNEPTHTQNIFESLSDILK